MVLIQKRVLALVDILYWLPDYENILQQFIWQTEDIKPEYPRINVFLKYWKNNIDAVIAEVTIADNLIHQQEVKHVRKVWNV